MDSNEFKKLWRKVIDLEAKVIANDGKLSRGKIKRTFDLTENDARFIYEALKHRVSISSNVLRADVAIREDNRKVKTRLRESTRQIEKLTRQVELLSELSEFRLDPPKWIIPPVPKKGVSVASAILSDTHWDEVIDPSSILWVNGYDRVIAVERLKKFCASLIKLDRDYSSGTLTSGLVLNLLGDMVSGSIHEELEATNESEPTETLLFWSEQLSAAISVLLEHFKKMYIPCVIGNHGRTKKKVEFKHDVKKSWDWLLYNVVARDFRKERNVKFYISTSTDAQYPIYETKYYATHGNQFRGGQGWAGAIMPVMRGDMKKKKRQNDLNRHYDVMLIGHFHTLQFLQSVIMNGSVIGYNEFADRGNFGFEVPQQAFWLTDPEHGVTIKAPIHCKVDNEPWENKGNVKNGIDKVISMNSV